MRSVTWEVTRLSEAYRSTMIGQLVHEVRLGTVKAAIWANETQSSIRHNVTFARLEKDGDEWKTSDSFGRDELPLLAKVADMAYTWIFRKGRSAKDG